MKTEYDVVTDLRFTRFMEKVKAKLAENWEPLGGVWYGQGKDPIAQAMTRDIPDEPEPAEDMNSRPFSKEFIRGYNAHDDDLKKPAPTPEQMFEAVCLALVDISESPPRTKSWLRYLACRKPGYFITAFRAELAKIQERDSC